MTTAADGAALVALLVDGPGAALLDSLPPYDQSQVLALTSRLRDQGHDPTLISAALTQSALRARGAAKFGPAAASMFFTPDGLEQATRPRIAALHAARFTAAGVRELVDLGCGIGSDARTFAAAGLNVRAVEIDPATAAIARANLADTQALVEVADATTVSIPADCGVWLDPARRTTGVADISGRTKRTFRLDELLPSWEFVTALGASGRPVGAKLSPSFPHRSLPAGASAEWVSLGGEVLECALWFGPLAAEFPFSARVLGNEGEVVVTADSPAPQADSTQHLAGYLYEADRAVVRAGVTGALAQATSGVELSPGLGHVSSDLSVDLAYARRYRLLEAMPWNPKRLRAWLRERRVGRVTVKKRGVSFDDATFRRELKLKGPEHALLLVTRLGEDQLVLVLEPDEM